MAAAQAANGGSKKWFMVVAAGQGTFIGDDATAGTYTVDFIG